MKKILSILKDIGLFIVLALFVIGSVWGIILPYRNPFLGTGDYQLELFPKGLAIFQYNRVSPFYKVYTDQELVTSTPKYKQVLNILSAYFGSSIPSYAVVQSDGWIKIYAQNLPSNLHVGVFTNRTIPGTLEVRKDEMGNWYVKGEQ